MSMMAVTEQAVAMMFLTAVAAMMADPNPDLQFGSELTSLTEHEWSPKVELQQL